MHTMNHDIIRVHRPPLKFSSLPNLIFCSGPPHNFFGLKFLDAPLKLGGEGGGEEGGCYHLLVSYLHKIVMNIIRTGNTA